MDWHRIGTEPSSSDDEPIYWCIYTYLTELKYDKELMHDTIKFNYTNKYPMFMR